MANLAVAQSLHLALERLITSIVMYSRIAPKIESLCSRFDELRLIGVALAIMDLGNASDARATLGSPYYRSTTLSVR